MVSMRRSDRAVADAAGLRGIVEACRVLHIGAVDEEGMFIVPVSFGCEWGAVDGESASQTPNQTPALSLYVHSAGEGRKARAFSRGADVAFEMDVDGGIIEGASACAYSQAFRSVMGSGRIAAVEDAAEKRHALALIMEHMAPDAPREFPAAMVEHTAVFRIDVREVSGKCNPRA